jgi:release factor glutamine methyltransferase
LSILPDKNEETPENTLKALWSTASGRPLSVRMAGTISPGDLSNSQINYLDQMIDSRLKGTPLAYLTGRQSFMGLEMIASQAALIPRKETEILAATAINIIKKYMTGNINVIDTCTGAGNIALAIASYCNNTTVFGADLSGEAATLAGQNSRFLGLEGRVSFFSGDLLQPFEGLGIKNHVSLLTCNPPYISSSKVADMPKEISDHEPKLAFDGGAFGINLIKRLVTEAADYLLVDGFLVFEVGLGQGDIIKKLVEKSNLYTEIKTIQDEAGQSRVISARKRSVN